MRPDDVVTMRHGDIDCSGDVWILRSSASVWQCAVTLAR
jgi:hypothetical protein